MSALIFSMSAGNRFCSVMSGNHLCSAFLLLVGVGFMAWAAYMLVKEPAGFKA